MFSGLADKFLLLFLFKLDYEFGLGDFMNKNILAPCIYEVLYAAYFNNPMNELIITGGKSRGEAFLPFL